MIAGNAAAFPFNSLDDRLTACSALQCALFSPAKPSSVMSTDIKADALLELEILASWVSQSAEMKEGKGKKNLLECVDKAREAKARPLLEKLGYATIRVIKRLIRFKIFVSEMLLIGSGSFRFAIANMRKGFD
mgnify:FL=1